MSGGADPMKSRAFDCFVGGLFAGFILGFFMSVLVANRSAADLCVKRGYADGHYSPLRGIVCRRISEEVVE
jgi:hypothetical protein